MLRSTNSEQLNTETLEQMGLRTLKTANLKFGQSLVKISRSFRWL